MEESVPAAAKGEGKKKQQPAASNADANTPPVNVGNLNQKYQKGKQSGGKKTFTEDQSKLLTLMVKLLLQLAQGSREVMGAIFETFLAPETDTVIVAMSKQGKRYAHLVKEGCHGLGTPHIYVMGGLLNALATENEANPNPVMTKLEEEYKNMEIARKEELVRLCKVAKLFRTDCKKVVLAFGPGPEVAELKNIVVAALRSRKDWEYKVGKAPQGHMERLL